MRGEPLPATASRVERWLLAEHCGPWGPPTLPLARMDPAVAAHLTAEAARLGARLLLLRHPRGVACPPGRNVFLADSRDGQESLRRRHFADDAILLDTPLADAAGFVPADGPLLLVCTHGRHDRCCAVRGRPVAEVLAARWPERTWECTHVGGDRFAANVVVLPQGWYLARLEAADAVPAVEALHAGRLPVPNLRGRSSSPLPVQAAEHFARTQLGRDGADDLRLLEQTADGADTWTVRMAGARDLPDVEVRVRFERAARPPALLTCGAAQESAAPAFSCLSLTALVG